MSKPTQVLLNLEGNAIKFTEPGAARVTAKRERHLSASASEVGRRISEDQNTHVFSQFQKVDSSNTKAKGSMVSDLSSPNAFGSYRQRDSMKLSVRAAAAVQHEQA